jgi:hypothetical protein
MNYVIALLVPPIPIALAGRPILAVVVFLVWVPSILISGGLGHPIFILLAWIVVYQSGAERRHRQALRHGRRDKD